MHDQVLVRMLDRLADVAEESQPLRQRRGVHAAILRERQSVDVLHDEPRRAVGEGVGIEEPRDERVTQLREQSLLARETLATRR